ncbi:hypothetical protein QBC34DRAFT_403131 [Podospora aff. communis PSN243]|uniref:Uncharacterized protein n=1 Tax=Podospora aff. communis PSN243 TaxID=3040156 RepID=A0AAV9GN29_9PEZI|nr:hypothetical protein QBC34DRAFT_403131 [Podospora aff. communis PSN243]
MAKRRPNRSVVQLEDEMGFQLHLVEGSSPTTSGENKLFSDLRPVSTLTDIQRAEKEHAEFIRKKKQSAKESTGTTITLPQGGTETMVYDGDSVRLEHGRGPGFYRFPVDIHYGFGLDLSFLFSESEAAHVLSMTKLSNPTTTSSRLASTLCFLDILPLEIRQSIYQFALPRGIWRMVDDEDFERNGFPRGVGDPSGFYYPLSKSLSVLRINKQIRREALPFAYRRTTFFLDNLDSAIRLLIAVGKVGRDNIETLHLVWESSSEPANNWDSSPTSNQGPEQLLGGLPSRTASTCIRLLKQCKRLRHMTLQFDSDLIQEMGPVAFKADLGIQGLCTLQGIRKLEIQEMGMASLDPDLGKWLKGQMEGQGIEDRQPDT